MWVLAVEQGATLLGVAAIISALGGLVSTIIALRKGRTEDHEKCIKNLQETRAEAERLAAELHEIKMGRRAPE